MRMNKMIIKEKISYSFNLFLKEMYGDQFGEFVCGYLGLKGSLSNNWMRLSMICRIMGTEEGVMY